MLGYQRLALQQSDAACCLIAIRGRRRPHSTILCRNWIYCSHLARFLANIPFFPYNTTPLTMMNTLYHTVTEKKKGERNIFLCPRRFQVLTKNVSNLTLRSVRCHRRPKSCSRVQDLLTVDEHISYTLGFSAFHLGRWPIRRSGGAWLDRKHLNT